MNNYKYYDISKTGSNLVNIDVIRESVFNILSTRRGERLFNRDFGCKLEDFLFRPMSFSVSRLILSELHRSINKYEPRVIISNKTNVIPDYENRKYIVNLVLEVKGDGSSINITKEYSSKG